MVGGNFFAVVFVLLVACCSFADALTQEQYWNQTGLNFEVVKNKFRGSCYKNQKSFVACIRSLDVAAGLMKPAGLFALDQEVQAGSPIIGAKEKDFGPLKLYGYKSVPNAKLPTYWPSYKAARDLQIKVAAEFFATGESTKIDFAAILADLKPKILTGKLSQSEGLVSGMLINSFLSSAVDPHTRIQPRAQIDDNSKSLDVTFAGIGATVGLVNDQVIIQNPMPDGPAFAAGIKAKDIIVSIDGTKLDKKDISEVSNALKGPEGTRVKLGLIRKGTPYEIEVVRGKITIPNLSSRMLTDANASIGYLKLSSFMETDICEKMAGMISDFESKGAKGLILDLRGNGGGFMGMAICIGSLFVGKNVIVKQVDIGDGKETDYVGSTDAITSLPLVTLIDAGSASASEILAGALQDYGRSWIAGDRSYGKASVQAESDWTTSAKKVNAFKRVQSWFLPRQSQPVDLGKTIGLWHTISRFYQPSGRTNQIVGIIPDFYIDPFPNATADDKFALREADLYTNALPPLGPVWKEARPQKVSAITSCLNAGPTNEIFQKKQDDAISPDYRLIAGQVLLTCDR